MQRVGTTNNSTKGLKVCLWRAINERFEDWANMGSKEARGTCLYTENQAQRKHAWKRKKTKGIFRATCKICQSCWVKYFLNVCILIYYLIWLTLWTWRVYRNIEWNGKDVGTWNCSSETQIIVLSYRISSLKAVRFQTNYALSTGLWKQIA